MTLVIRLDDEIAILRPPPLFPPGIETSPEVQGRAKHHRRNEEMRRFTPSRPDTLPVSPAMLQGCRPKCCWSCKLMNTLAILLSLLQFTSDKQVSASDIWPAPRNQVPSTASISYISRQPSGRN